MFVDFDTVFRKIPQNELQIPKELADHLSEQLPNGLHYIIDKENNMLTISPETDEECSFSGLTLAPTDQQKEILGDKYSVEDIMNLSYNSQQAVPAKLKDNKYIIINGADVPIERFSYNPFKPNKIIQSSIFIYPAPFPPAFPVKIGNDITTIELSVKRVPNNSISTLAFESDPAKCLNIKYSIEPTKNQFSITINVLKENAASIKELVNAIEIYNAFVEGKGRIGETLLEKPLNTTSNANFNEEILEFWKKVLLIEDVLCAEFNPNASDLSMECICEIEEIYQNIVNKAPVRHNTSINNITSKWELKKDKIAEDAINIPIYFEFNGTKEFDIFGQKIVLYCISGVFNAVITKYEKNEKNNECTIYLENESDKKKMYTSSLCFVTEEAAVKYKEETDNRILQLRDAKRVDEYLKNEQ